MKEGTRPASSGSLQQRDHVCALPNLCPLKGRLEGPLLETTSVSKHQQSTSAKQRNDLQQCLIMSMHRAFSGAVIDYVSVPQLT